MHGSALFRWQVSDRPIINIITNTIQVITELDGLSKSDNELGNAALIATSYLDVAVERSKSLKVGQL